MTDIGVLKGRAEIAPFNTQQELWVQLRGSTGKGILWLKSEGIGPVSVDIESGPDLDPANLDSANKATLNFTQKGQVERQDLPVPAAVTPTFPHYARIRATGLMSAAVSDPNEILIWTRKRPELEA